MLLSGLVALVPVAALYMRFGCGWRMRVSKRGPKDDDDDLNAQANTATTGVDREARKRYHDALEQLKENANEMFKGAKFDTALEMYQGCLDMCAALGTEDAKAVQISQVVRANVVLVFLKLQRPEEARMLATFLLQDDTSPVDGELKVKVLYRRGLASQELGDRESALCDFNAAVAFSPGGKNPAVQSAIVALSRSATA
ncbi:hypothetical protein TraAM80_00540 [Trypanosoma rangeli]|uniref:Uncharacterized protein n=1 Tax=Trypanosoma rangeli TaxID=5698 RepID=A0A422P344_TRYRA|nr:uncharacterized protein TraAM80_00540 [Trypanosoma rangeli]RNF12119.1 hypothetical protein TraAM80_00540 [Trypanosoma rangeli]|eukprot:RNF12119.1 hypothetical protein TraAM80_00540 [Trypanosoma rangeli]